MMTGSSDDGERVASDNGSDQCDSDVSNGIGNGNGMAMT